MKLSKLAALALTALLVTAGAAAAMPGNAPDFSGADEHAQADDHRPDDADDAREDNETDVDEDADTDAANESDDGATDDGNATKTDDEHAADARRNADGNGPASAAANARAGNARGPPVDLPKGVPDHVRAIHELILKFLSGDLDGKLGPAVSDVTPEDASENATADASG